MATVKCDKCGKDLETVGLNRTYPPKKDDMGRVICPHCGHAHGSEWEDHVPIIKWSVRDSYDKEESLLMQTLRIMCPDAVFEEGESRSQDSNGMTYRSFNVMDGSKQRVGDALLLAMANEIGKSAYVRIRRWPTLDQGWSTAYKKRMWYGKARMSVYWSKGDFKP